MPITRTFIDWSQRALPAVVEYLGGRYQRGSVLDLDQVVLVFPGARAGRRLLEVIVEHAAEHDLVLLPPHRCTVGLLPELLYQPKRPFASDLVQRLAWVQGAPGNRPGRVPALPAAAPGGRRPRWLAGARRHAAAAASRAGGR